MIAVSLFCIVVSLIVIGIVMMPCGKCKHCGGKNQFPVMEPGENPKKHMVRLYCPDCNQFE